MKNYNLFIFFNISFFENFVNYLFFNYKDILDERFFANLNNIDKVLLLIFNLWIVFSYWIELVVFRR